MVWGQLYSLASRHHVHFRSADYQENIIVFKKTLFRFSLDFETRLSEN